MKREIIITKDGSSTINLPEINEQYHSKNGSIEEAYHVYIKYELDEFKGLKKVHIMEAGFGTGYSATFFSGNFNWGASAYNLMDAGDFLRK